VAELLNDHDQNIRVSAVRLLPRFPPEFAAQALRARARDESADLRSVVADVIGEVKLAELVPILTALFEEPVGNDPPMEPITFEYLRAGQRGGNIGDVHTSAGFALLRFDNQQVAGVLKNHLDDPGFHINFISKLAEQDAGPWLPELASILEARLTHVEEHLKLPPLDPRRFEDPMGDRLLIGTYSTCWQDIRQYLLGLPEARLSGGEMNRYLDLLETTVRPSPGCTGCAVPEARSLYELYWAKHLPERAAELRRRFDKTEGWWFDEFARQH